MPVLSIIVISYNTKALTRACLASVYRETVDTDFELLVVDNASSDGSGEMVRREFPDATLFLLDENEGFARANNRAAVHAVGDYILLLNPDTVVLDHAIDTLIAFARAHPEHRVYGGATRFGDGTRNPTSGWMMSTGWSLFTSGVGLSSFFRGSRVFDSESLARRRWDHPREVDIVTGCFLLIERTLWQRLEGFDARFYMYGEDADLCLRARATGIRPILCPQAEIIHYGGASEAVRTEKMIRLFRAKVQLFRKHWSAAGAAYAIAMLKLNAWSRSIALALGARIKPSLSDGRDAWRGVWRRREEWAREA